MPGPIPNRTEDLARPRERKGSDVQSVTNGVLRDVVIPHASKDWHPLAKRLWDGMKTSGQADFMQNSDWAFAYSLMDDLTYYKNSGKRSSQMLQTIYGAMTTLMITEGDRRRVRLELQAPPDGSQDAELFAIDGYKDALGVQD